VKIRPVEAELLYANRQTDVTKLIVVFFFQFCESAKKRKTCSVSDQSCREIKTHFMFNNFFFSFFRKSCTVCEITWKYILEPDGLQVTIWRMRTACWVPKATNRLWNTYYLLLSNILSRERASMLRYTYIACLVKHWFLLEKSIIVLCNGVTGCVSSTRP
jgi:hypothetical protein